MWLTIIHELLNADFNGTIRVTDDVCMISCEVTMVRCVDKTLNPKP